MSRMNFPQSVRKDCLARATDKEAGVVRCEGCGRVVKRGGYDFDHVLADWLGGKPTLENCKLLCNAECHPAKTAKDIEKIAKSKRIEARELGIATPKPKIQSRGFEKSQKTPLINKAELPELPRRQLYRDIERN